MNSKRSMRKLTMVKELKASNISVKYDDNDNNRPGWKFAEYEMKGVPVRIALGARDMENNVVEVVRRDTKEKRSVSLDGLSDYIINLLGDIQQTCSTRQKLIATNILQKLIPGMILKKYWMRKVVLFLRIGMARQKQKKQSKKKPKLPFAVFL